MSYSTRAPDKTATTPRSVLRRVSDALRTAWVQRKRGGPEPAGSAEPAGTSIRHAVPDDAAALWRLAQLDSAAVPSGALLVAEVRGELWAAMSITTGEAVADPFRPSGSLALALTRRVRELKADERRLLRAMRGRRGASPRSAGTPAPREPSGDSRGA